MFNTFNISISLSLCVYIYIYIHTHSNFSSARGAKLQAFRPFRPGEPDSSREGEDPREFMTLFVKRDQVTKEADDSTIRRQAAFEAKEGSVRETSLLSRPHSEGGEGSDARADSGRARAGAAGQPYEAGVWLLKSGS